MKSSLRYSLEMEIHIRKFSFNFGNHLPFARLGYILHVLDWYIIWQIKHKLLFHRKIMKKISLLAVCLLSACQPTPENLQSFNDLLKITDTTDTQICTLSLTELRHNLTVSELEKSKALAFDFDKVIEQYAHDPVTQIRIIYRRTALRRRLNVEDDDTELANEFYKSLSASEEVPTTLKGFHDGFHYWVDRISEQNQFGDQDSVAYNLRFCVMNEKRAELHAASRKEIITRVEQGVDLPAPELIENVNHETSFNDGFAAHMLANIFTDENSESLTPLARAQMRAGKSFLPFDPKKAKEFWEKKDEEISAIIKFIQSHSFSVPADKLSYMTDMDLSLRRLATGPEAENHFDNSDEYKVFLEGLTERIWKVDKFNTLELQNMLEGRGWFRDDLDGPGAANDGWLIAQHADRNPDFQIKALELIEAELDAPGVSKSNYAYLYDRVQLRLDNDTSISKRLQRYGTQGRCTGLGTWEPFPVVAPDRIDDIRAEVGLSTLAAYKAQFRNICKNDER